MIQLLQEIVAAVVTVWFMVALGMTHYFGRAGMPTKGNKIAHFFFDREH